MLFSAERLGKKSPAGFTTVDPGQPIPDALSHLIDCHTRIEQRLEILETAVPRLGAATAEKRQEAREVVDRALKFLSEMGHLHTVDEEETLFPRLRASAKAKDLELPELAEALEAQHRQKEAVLTELLALVEALPPATEAPTPDRVSRLDGYAAQLAGLYRPHIMLENNRLIPLCREAPSTVELEQIAQEMRDRRQG